MPSGFQAFTETGQLMFDVNNICYGLIKSGPLVLTGWVGKWYLRSAHLDPTDPGNYAQENAREPIAGITVNNSISPIVFLDGPGSYVGETISGSNRTINFCGMTNGTKAYVFDLMADRGTRAGMQCFSETGILTYTSEQPALNVIASISAPTMNPWYMNTSYQYPTAYVNGSNDIAFPKTWGNSPSGASQYNEIQHYAYVDVPAAAGQRTAAYLNWTRSGFTDQKSSQVGAQEGAGGDMGRVKFILKPAVGTTSKIGSVSGNESAWGGFPTDRIPQALVIRTSEYPYPFSV